MRRWRDPCAVRPHLLVFVAKVPMFGMMIVVGTAQKIGLFVLFAALEIAGVVFVVREFRRAKSAGEYEPPEGRGAFRSETVRSDLLRVFRR